MLELGKAGSAGVDRHVVPVLRDGAVVATLHGKRSKQPGTATIGTQTWVLEQTARELTARLPGEPEGTARLRARRTSMWRGTWTADLEGAPVEVQTASVWKSTRRYLVAGRVVAESGTTGSWSPRTTLTTQPDLPAHHAVFLLWLDSVLRGAADGSGAVFGDGGDGGGGGGGD